MSYTDQMLEAATKALNHAYAPYSQFRVGVCLRTENNELFSGCNVENASYSLTICAESTAISQMVLAGKSQIVEVVIVSSGDLLCPPCGACRQRLCEFASDDTIVRLYNADRECKSIPLGELLPHAFGAKNLSTL